MLVFEMPELEEIYRGTGVSKGLDRGLLVYDNGALLVEEGMAIGACAFQAGGYTYFASVKSIERKGSFIEVESQIDTRLEISVLGIKSKLVTKTHEMLVKHFYMKQENWQEKLLKKGEIIRKIFDVNTCFVKGPSLGTVKTVYEVGNGIVKTDLSCCAKIGGRFFVMNELGGSKFDKSIVNGEVLFAPSGWQKIETECELYSDSHSLAFTVAEDSVPENVRSSLYWGREYIEDFCSWSGFESEIKCSTGKFENYRYKVVFRRVAR
ncbi:MAG: hypothetical protein H6Q58_94 [Firmicutes bacterium]|nr:hypothetical protein [Bacillota bacterium]